MFSNMSEEKLDRRLENIGIATKVVTCPECNEEIIISLVDLLDGGSATEEICGNCKSKFKAFQYIEDGSLKINLTRIN